MIRFLRPEAFLLVPLLAALLRHRALSTPAATALRVVVALLLAGVLAEPRARSTDEGRDLVVAVDRSRSMPPGAATRVEETLDRAAREAGTGDRVGVVSFGREAVLEHAPRPEWRRVPFAAAPDPDGTDLAAAIDAALAAIPPGRPGSVLVVSDGETTGADPEAAARRAERRGVRVDVVPVRRAGTADAAVVDVSLPPEVAAGEPFQVAAWVRSDRPVEATVRLFRDGKPVAEGRRAFGAGAERVTFRDVVLEPGLHEVSVEVSAPGDRVPENDRARAPLRVSGAFRVLCVTPGGREDRLTRSLAAAGIDVVVSAPASAPATLDALDGFGAVVLEDVPAADFPDGALDALARHVADHGGGLLMTGGRASFGPGGWHLSPVEAVLPVSLEMREEQRRFSLAMAIVLDRSGSMAVPAPGGPTKMDLANRGAIAAIDLLTGLDAVAIVAVDSEPHVVVPLRSAGNKAEIAARVRRIESMGGGIFVGVGLHAGARQLAKATQGSKHMILFADAADAEEPADARTLVPALRAAGTTTSVIGLGSDEDPDAELLKDLARLGGGRVFFAKDAKDLPRIFAQETIEVARSAFVEEPCAVATLPGLATLGALRGTEFPSVGGYVIAYLKPGATAGLRTRDETAAPLFSFRQAGLGRAAAFLGVADGPWSGGLATWDGYAEFFSTVVRWTAGTDASDEVHATAVRRGHEGVLVVEVPRGRDDLLARLDARVADPSGAVRRVDLVRTGATRAEGRFPLAATGVHRPVIDAGDGRRVRVAPLALPYSPEHEPRTDPEEGEATLRRVAARTGGRVDPASGTLFDGPRGSASERSLVGPFALAATLAFLLEILVRRTGWRPDPRAAIARLAARLRRRPRVAPAGAPDAAPTAATVAARAAAARPAGKAAAPRPREAPDEPPEPPTPGASPAARPKPPPPSGGIADVVDPLRKRRPPS